MKETIVPSGFATRHIGQSDENIDQMLRTISVDSLEDLINETVPANIQSQTLNGLSQHRPNLST